MHNTLIILLMLNHWLILSFFIFYLILTCIIFCNFFYTASSNLNFSRKSNGSGDGDKISEGVAGF